MYPILTRHGSFFFYSYTAAMGAGLLLAVGAALYDTRRRQALKGAAWLDGVIIAILVALIVGRVVFVALNWDYFGQHAGESWMVWRGGISYHGALLSGLVVLWAWARWRGVSLGALGDLLALPAAVWTLFGWLACYLDGCAFGRETFVGLLAADLPDEFGVFAIRYQTQLLGMLLSAAVVLVIAWLQRRGAGGSGALWWLALGLLSGGRALVGTLRGDEMLMWGSLRADAALDVALAGVAVLFLWRALASRRKVIENERQEES